MKKNILILSVFLFFCMNGLSMGAFLAEEESAAPEMKPAKQAAGSTVIKNSENSVSAIPKPAESVPPNIVAVADFENYSKDSRFDFMRKGIADAIIGKIQSVDGVMIVERTRLDSIMQELQLGQSGLMNDVTIQKLGRSLAAGKMIVGGYEYNSITKNIRINARIVEIETGLIIGSDTVIDSEIYADELQKTIGSKMKSFFMRKYGNRTVLSAEEQGLAPAAPVTPVKGPQTYANFREYVGSFFLDKKVIESPPAAKAGKMTDFINSMSK